MVASPHIGGEQMALALKYSGPEVDDGAMGVYDVAANMVGMSDYVVSAAHAVYGDKSRVTAQVRAFNRGSFEIELLFHMAGLTGSVLAAQPNLPDLFAAIKDSFELFKFLKGEPPAAVSHNVEQGTVHVENLNGDLTTVNINALNITLDPKAGEAIGQVVGEMLSKRALRTVSLSDDAGQQVSVDRDEASSFRKIDMDKEISQFRARMILQVEMAGFKDGLKWKLSDGEHSFQAIIRDNQFLERVDGGEPFRKGDILDCDVTVRQWQSYGGRLRMERLIELVHEHRHSTDGIQNEFYPPDTPEED